MPLQDHLNLLDALGVTGERRESAEKFIRALPADSPYMQALDALAAMPAQDVPGKSKREVVEEAVRTGKVLTKL